MEPRAKPLPPPPVASNNSSDSPVLPTSSPSSTTSPRIRRKPLPASAFSPRSIISSPISVISESEELPRIVAPQSGSILNDILESPLRSAKPPRRKPIPTTNHPSINDKTTASPSQAVSIGDFPLLPQHEAVTKNVINENVHKSLNGEEVMAMRTAERPPPLRMEPVKAIKALDVKKVQSPGGVFTSFFSRRPTQSPQNISPGGESSATDISDTQSTSPFPLSAEENAIFAQQSSSVSPLQRQASWQSSQSSNNYVLPRRMNSGASGSIAPSSGDLTARCNALEAELKDISRELAGSIRRELDLEDLVERFQAEAPLAPMSIDRTSDYFSDSGTSSVRHPTSEYSAKEEIDKIKRESEQQRAQLRIELSQKWQSEVTQRKTLESHVQILESRLSQSRQISNNTSDASARIRELESSLDDARRRLVEERQTKENFEDLLTALRVDLEQHRNERDNLRDEIVPNLRSQIDGLESSFGETQKQAYDFARMQQEIQHLKDENAAIASARKMEQEMMRAGMQLVTDGGLISSPRSSLIAPKSAGLNRSSTISNRGPVLSTSLSPSDTPSRTNSILHKNFPVTPDSLNAKLHAVEQQRDALHSAVKYLRSRYEHRTKADEKRIRNLEAQLKKLNGTVDDGKRGGYEKEVHTLRQEINLLRKRADDALDQKWQCEKGLAGLKMDLDRSKQETASLQRLLQARGSDDPELLSAALEDAMKDLQRTRAQGQETIAALEQEQQIANQLQESAERAEALAIQVRQQLNTNSSLRVRLKLAVESGEENQHASALQVSELQSKLKKLEETITTTQFQSETAVMKHEAEIQNLKASHNAQLMRAKAGIKSPTNGQFTPMSPMFAVKSPKIGNTSSGPGMSLNQALKTEVLENKVAELEKALRDAEREMEEVVGRMNEAQIGVFELQQERDEAHRRTRQLESEVKAERERFQALVTNTAQ